MPALTILIIYTYSSAIIAATYSVTTYSSEAATGGVLKIVQISQENNCVGVSF